MKNEPLTKTKVLILKFLEEVTNDEWKRVLLPTPNSSGLRERQKGGIDLIMDSESFHYRGSNFVFLHLGEERPTTSIVFHFPAERCQSPLWSFEEMPPGGESLFSALKSPPSSEPKVVLPSSPDVLIAT